tara:strand:- start:623 stop:1141 length:519 start_codon:yes stop_codon:yes gene_type:complete
MKLSKSNYYAIVGIIMLLTIARLLPHPPNFTPILGMAVFSGAIISRRLIAYLIPLAAMFLSDLYLGLHASIPIIYFSLALCVLVGTFIESRVSIVNSLLSICLGVLVFYLITNFAVWYGSGMYESSISGLITCYFMGLPFVQNTFISSLLYGMGAFLIYDIINKYIIFRKNA